MIKAHRVCLALVITHTSYIRLVWLSCPYALLPLIHCVNSVGHTQTPRRVRQAVYFKPVVQVPGERSQTMPVFGK